MTNSVKMSPLILDVLSRFEGNELIPTFNSNADELHLQTIRLSGKALRAMQIGIPFLETINSAEVKFDLRYMSAFDISRLVKILDISQIDRNEINGLMQINSDENFISTEQPYLIYADRQIWVSEHVVNLDFVHLDEFDKVAYIEQVQNVTVEQMVDIGMYTFGLSMKDAFSATYLSPKVDQMSEPASVPEVLHHFEHGEFDLGLLNIPNEDKDKFYNNEIEITDDHICSIARHLETSTGMWYGIRSEYNNYLIVNGLCK